MWPLPSPCWHLEVDVSIGQVVGVDFVQKVDVLDEKVEHRDDDLLSAAVGCLRPLRGTLQGRAIVAEVAGWVHVVLWAGLGGAAEPQTTRRRPGPGAC